MDQQERYILDFTHPLGDKRVIEYQLDQEFWRAFKSEEIDEGNVTACVTLTPVRDVIEVSIDLKGSVVVQCDRCLDPLTIDVQSEEQLTIEIGDEERDDDLLITLSKQQPTYDIAPLLYTMVVLALPLQRMHEIDDCNPDMVRYLVANAPDEEKRNSIDPRFEALKASLKEKK